MNQRDFHRIMKPMRDDGVPDEPSERPERGRQCCGNCNAFGTMNGQTVCYAVPPTPFFVGMGQTKTLDATGQPKQVPIIWGLWPPIDEHQWCRAWQWAGPPKKDGGA